jgi:hypothetical protein
MAHPEMIKYRREFVATYNIEKTFLADRFTEESMDMGRSAIFDVATLGGRMAKRSIDGRIPRRPKSDTQVTCTLEEYVGKEEVTDFEAFTSQADERTKMNRSLMISVNEEIDFVILNELANASTSYSGTAAPITLDTATKVIATVAQNKVPIGANDLTWIISPMMEAKLQNITGYTSADYVSTKPLEGGGNQYSGERKIKSWLGAGWIVHPNLPSTGTSSCTTYLVHRRAFGLAVPSSQIKYAAGYNDEDHYHYCSATLKAGAKVLQNGGILKFLHNDAA